MFSGMFPDAGGVAFGDPANMQWSAQNQDSDRDPLRPDLIVVDPDDVTALLPQRRGLYLFQLTVICGLSLTDDAPDFTDFTLVYCEISTIIEVNDGNNAPAWYPSPKATTVLDPDKALAPDLGYMSVSLVQPLDVGDVVSVRTTGSLSAVDKLDASIDMGNVGFACNEAFLLASYVGPWATS
ncbi:hypothetical protein [Jatrophihabitans sp.]|uniref:hypothetical protein n=1 Tax=Jatrophihabitans sp. TaxID=1932789 RepID=UPI0030C70DDB